jgi:sec-independent protein translocase protein TatA
VFRNGLQFWHLVVLLLVVLILFGANRLPDVARSVGKSMKILKEEVRDLRDDPGSSRAPAPPTSAPPTTPPATSSGTPGGPIPGAPDDRAAGPGAADR